jgi:DNA polymerase III alpha subunit
VKKGDFETLVIHSSLIRPAAYRWVDRYVKRSRGEEAWEPSDPVFNELLSESFGVLVYQEDVIKVCVALAGWGHFEADQLRKLLGKPDCETKLPFFEARFRNGAAARGVRASAVDEAWDMIRTFTGYSFCKPHSASYAQVSFESAWIKAHHPAVFFAAVITNQGGYYPAIAYLGDARRHRLVVRGPDTNASAWPFTAEGEQALRVGLMQVRGAIKDEVQELLREREARGPFEHLGDLLGRVKLSVTTAEALCVAGAFDRWAPDGDRTRLLWARLGGVPTGVRPRPTDPFDRADLEMETMGLTLELHPAALARVRKGGGPNRAADTGKASPRRRGEHGVFTERNKENASQHSFVRSFPSPPCLRGESFSARRLCFWALIVADKELATEKGERMQFITCEDETGLCEAVAFPEAIRRRQRPFRVGEIVCISGKTTELDGLAVFEVG